MAPQLIRRSAGALAAAGVLALGACATAQEAAQDAATETASGQPQEACPVEVDESVTAEVEIAFQPIPNGDLVVRDAGWLEACLPEATISWSQFASGAEVVQAFGSGSVDIGLVGSSPMAKLVSPEVGMDAQVVWIQDVIGEAESLVSRTGAQSLEDLAGATVAVPYGSTAHFSLLNALGEAGLEPGTDLTLINLSPDAMVGAWERGEIDAAWVWNPTLEVLLESGEIVLSSEDTAAAGTPTYDLTAATTEFISANPEFMATWTALQDEAVRVIREEPERAGEAIGAQLGVAPEEATELLEGYVYLRASEQAGEEYFGGKLGEDLVRTADFLLAQQEVSEIAPPGVYEQAVYADAIDTVAP
ncbi:taurine ABC transporter substrate-binding protein [Georgenia satyanarayanai]|uniref:taurine ABC transporter substrate-binding protein n=1 Tax=Georgenia satyanarayanai TaxID=860221 RepID=UPI0012640E35|nr:ABC transporter substrate-binding protein [Georgenia satyanarayanai]